MRAMNDVIVLVCEAKVPDESGFPQTQTLNQTEVFAQINSVKRNEFYLAGREGIKLAYSVYVNPDDFIAAAVEQSGKRIAPSKVIYDGQTYSIYRTYQESEVFMELILQEVV